MYNILNFESFNESLKKPWFFKRSKYNDIIEKIYNYVSKMDLRDVRQERIPEKGWCYCFTINRKNSNNPLDPYGEEMDPNQINVVLSTTQNKIYINDIEIDVKGWEIMELKILIEDRKKNYEKERDENIVRNLFKNMNEGFFFPKKPLKPILEDDDIVIKILNFLKDNFDERNLSIKIEWVLSSLKIERDDDIIVFSYIMNKLQKLNNKDIDPYGEEDWGVDNVKKSINSVKVKTKRDESEMFLYLNDVELNVSEKFIKEILKKYFIPFLIKQERERVESERRDELERERRKQEERARLKQIEIENNRKKKEGIRQKIDF